MGNIIFLYANLFDSATITASSAATGFPASNLKNPFRGKVWRTAGATAGTAQLVVNYGGATSVTAVALTGYNWASAPGTLAVQFNAADNWGAPSATETLTFAASPTTQGNKGVILKTFQTLNYQYNRLNVVYSPGGTATDWDLGRIFIGNYFQPTHNFLEDWSVDYIDESIRARTIGGQDHFDEVEKFRELRFSFMVVGDTQWNYFQTMINAVGIHKDLFVCFLDDDADDWCIYGKFAQLPSVSAVHYRNWRASFVFRESR